MENKTWHCSKCQNMKFEEDVVTMTGKSWSRFMNIQNRKFTAITCTKCKHTDFYKGTSKGWESVVDFLGN